MIHELAHQWRSEIDEAISTAAAAVLVLSLVFFALTFSAEHEFPALLAAAKRGEICPEGQHILAAAPVKRARQSG